MQDISMRISHIVDAYYNGNKSEFSRTVKITPAYATQLTNGQRIPSDRLISDICRNCGVREAWLRTGEGEMLEARTPGDEVGAIVADALRGQPEEAQAYFEQLLAGLTDGEILLLREVARRFVSRREAEKQTKNKQPPQD